MNGNQNVGQLFFTMPHGMAIMPDVVPGRWLIMFAYKDVDQLQAFTAQLAEDAKKVTVNVKTHVLAPKSLKCQHPEDKRHISEKGVFCLACNEPVLVALEPTGPSFQESPIHPAMIQKPPIKEVEEDGPETPRDSPSALAASDTMPPALPSMPFCGVCGTKKVCRDSDGLLECPNGH